MNFCSQCGNTVSLILPEGDNRERYVCSTCRTIHYQNPRIIAGCLPTLNDKILLCRRAIEPRIGLWTLPAGFMENDESALQGALRECEEEANARIDTPQLSGVFDIPHTNQVYIFYRGPMSDMNFSPGIESLEVGLFNEQGIPWKQLAFPVIELALHYHFEDLRTGRIAVRTGTITRPWQGIHS